MSKILYEYYFTIRYNLKKNYVIYNLTLTKIIGVYNTKCYIYLNLFFFNINMHFKI